MRVQFFVLSCLLPMFAMAGQDRLKYLDYEVTRAQAQAADAKLAMAGRELDAFLGSDAAKNFDSEANDMFEELPPEVNAIFARAGIDLENVGELSENKDSTSISALGFAVFKICDGESSVLLQLRKAWVARIFDLGFLSLSTEEKTQFSPSVVRQGRAEMLPLAQAYVDSWLAIAAVKVGCAQQAVRYADFALDDSSNEFADGILGMTRSGLLLNAAKGNAKLIEIALDARTKAMAQLLLGVEKLASFAEKAGLTATKEDFKSELIDFKPYDTEFQRAVLLGPTPIWRIEENSPSKVTNMRPNRHGSGEWIGAVLALLFAPEWPTALAVLHAKHQDEAVAAYELAVWFDTKNQLSAFNNHLSEFGNAPDSKALIWQAYGKAETRAEFERAANAITLSAPENGLAIVKLFGHEFLLASGEHNSQEPSQPTRWYTLAEIQANFRGSYVFEALTGKQ